MCKYLSIYVNLSPTRSFINPFLINITVLLFLLEKFLSNSDPLNRLKNTVLDFQKTRVYSPNNKQ